MRANNLLFGLLILFFSSSLWATNPPSDLSRASCFDLPRTYPVTSQYKNKRINQAIFNSLLTKVERTYHPIFKKEGSNLIVIKDWENSLTNAFAKKEGSTRIIHISGGLARHPYMVGDGILLVACHEIGHHLGGYPKISTIQGFETWSSAEGQADYYATLKCLREVFKNDQNESIIQRMNVPSNIANDCALSFQSANDQAICQRSIMASLQVSKVLESTQEDTTTVWTGRKDPTVVGQLVSAHNAPQCRLDTMIAGAVCESSRLIALSDTNPEDGSCTRKNGQVFGSRPLCWFHPN